jgi:SAM-dependent methyltransferase
VSLPRVDRWYPERRYGGFTHVDGTIAFYARVNAVVEPSTVLLDLGCGRGAAAEDPLPWRRQLQIFKGRCARVIGVDVDPAAAANPNVDEFHLITNGRLPLADETADICIADFVLEHVQDVDRFFDEAFRVLKPGGLLFIRTPNSWNYMGVATRLVPAHLHVRVLHRIQPGRITADVFPTYYRCNSVRRLRRALLRHSDDLVVQTHEPEPAYLSFSRLLYALAVFHQRHAPRRFRRLLFACARKS